MEGRRLIYGSIFCLICIVVFGEGEQNECTSGQSSFQKQIRFYSQVQMSKTVKTKTGILFWVRTKYKIQYNLDKKANTEWIKSCCPGYEMGENETCIEGCEVGKYGENCTFNCTCPENALDDCDFKTGNCTCKQGWTGSNCTEECTEGYYGHNCEERCFCMDNSTCNIYTGHCNCSSPSWDGFLCDKECEDGKFGMYCEENCTCNTDQSCDRINGECTCKAGRTGTDCQDACPPGAYGKDCAHNCSDNCNYTKYCDPFTGECVCIGKTGANCSKGISDMNLRPGEK